MVQTHNRIMRQVFTFDKKNRSEYHLVFHVENQTLCFSDQLNELLGELKTAAAEIGARPVLMRFFVSDAANQESALNETLSAFLAACGFQPAVSVIQQPPLDGTKVALWAWMRQGVEVSRLENGMTQVRDGDYTHYLTASCRDKSGVTSSEAQMRHLFNQYVKQLRDEDATLIDNCLRTWIFVQNVDVNYAGVVRARNDVFRRQRLTPETHFIASTGINGRSERWGELVQMDTYAIKGIEPSDVQYLHAPEFLNSTIEYGVAFERGTAVRLNDRRYVFISGTASINNRGEVVYVGDINKQTERMLTNVEALLADARCDFSRVAQMIVYLRDTGDYEVVKRIFERRFPNTPRVITLAPVCRPQWLIEMECIAVAEN